MPAYTRRTIKPGDLVTVKIPHSHRRVLQPLIGKLRTVKVTADLRAIIYEDDGSRYRVDGRTIAPVALVDAAIFIHPLTGQLWAETYDLPPRDTSPYPLPECYAAVAEPDGHGGIIHMLSCRCGRGCACPSCGQPTISVARGLDWADLLPNGKPHIGPDCRRPSCPSTGPIDHVDCCAMPMRLAPVGWVCRVDSAHRRPFRWP